MVKSRSRAPRSSTPSTSRPRSVNVSQISYKVASHHARKRDGALVDRGANGGIAGEDVCVIAKTGRQVDVQGIDNHQIVDVPIVTAGAVIQTQLGEVIAIMHQYAYTGKGKTIHSCGQLEAHKQIVDDKSKRVGGNQRIITIDGYVVPLNIRSGLPYMTMRPYTDTEWQQLPHVILTADTNWDPSMLDDEQEDNEEWFNAQENIPTFESNPLFDQYGEYRHTVDITEAIMSSTVFENSIITDFPSLYLLNPVQTQERTIDYDSYRSKLGWLPTDVIKRTFE